MAEEQKEPKKEIKKATLYNLNQFLIITKTPKNERLYYEKVFGTPYKEQSLTDWIDQTGIKFEE